jgi:hypothetical protein
LNNTAAEFSVGITSEESKVMAFRGPDKLEVIYALMRETWANHKL